MFALVKNQTVIDPVTQETSEAEVIKIFAPYTVWEDKNGTQYSPDHLIYLTSNQKQDLGIYDIAYATRLDDRFYTIVENAPTFDQEEKIVKITNTATPKELEDSGEGDELVKGLKSQWISQFKTTANSMLSATDWMLVRKIEREIDVPAATVAHRAAVVTEANRLETAIAAATTVEALITAVESASFPSAE
jgi:hypothetical protein